MGLDADLFELYAVPQIEFHLLLDHIETPIPYSAHRELWTLSSLKDEDGEHI